MELCIFLFQEVTFKVLQLVDDVSDAVLRLMTLSQKPLVINTRSVAVGLSKRKPDNLAGIALNAGWESQFVLPHKVSLVNETTNSYVTTTVSVRIWGLSFLCCFGF